MKAAKRIILSLALFALVLTLTPLVGHAFNQDTGEGGTGGGSGRAVWNVTCSYNGSNQLLSKTCSTGGSSYCSCPYGN